MLVMVYGILSPMGVHTIYILRGVYHWYDSMLYGFYVFIESY